MPKNPTAGVMKYLTTLFPLENTDHAACHCICNPFAMLVETFAPSLPKRGLHSEHAGWTVKGHQLGSSSMEESRHHEIPQSRHISRHTGLHLYSAGLTDWVAKDRCTRPLRRKDPGIRIPVRVPYAPFSSPSGDKFGGYHYLASRPFLSLRLKLLFGTTEDSCL